MEIIQDAKHPIDASEVNQVAMKRITQILLIEDNAGDARLVHEMLKSEKHFALSHLGTMGEAEIFLAQHNVDLILLDACLPDAEGLEALRRVRAAAPRRPIVMITGRTDESLALQALHEGAQDYLVKGHFEGQALLRSMRYAIERSICDEALCAARQQSEEGWSRLAAMHEATPDLVSISDPEGRLIYVNRGGRRMLGLTEQGDITGYVISDFLKSAADHPILVEGLPGAVRDGIWRGVSEVVSLDGAMIELSQVILAHKGPDGAVDFFSTIGRDVTQENRTNAALRESEARLRRLLDSNIIGVVFWNEAGDVLKANPLFLKMTGYSLSDLQSKNHRLIDLTPPQYAAAVARAREELMATGKCRPFEKELTCKDGSRITVLVSSALLDSQTDLGTSFIMDITERKQAEATTRLQSAALNAAANAIVILDQNFTIAWVNAAFTVLSGFEVAEAVGLRLRDMFEPGIHDAPFFDDLEATLRAGAVWSGETTKNRKDGSVYPEAETITPVRDEHGTITHFIAIKSDLTEQRRIEARLRQAHKMEAVGQLAAGVAHEFNNLLQGLMSMATLTRLRAFNSESASVATDMEVQIRRGAGLTQQLLLFSRTHEIDKIDLDLGELVQKAGILVGRLIPENIRVVIETPAERLSIKGDESQIQQVLLNLAINARDAMPAGGTLTLRAGSSGRDVFLEVADTGDGIDEVNRAHLFEPFFTTKEPGKGTGLGLAVVQGIVESHGGRVEVESRRGNGSLFRVILQAAAAGTEATPALLPFPAELQTGNGCVLLVEDEESVRAGLTELLNSIGYDVMAVGSGEQALAAPLEPVPDFLLSDITLPGIGGPDLGIVLSKRWPALRIVLMSGYLADESRIHARSRGWRFLQKPFELANLANALALAT